MDEIVSTMMSLKYLFNKIVCAMSVKCQCNKDCLCNEIACAILGSSDIQNCLSSVLVYYYDNQSSKMYPHHEKIFLLHEVPFLNKCISMYFTSRTSWNRLCTYVPIKSGRWKWILYLHNCWSCIFIFVSVFAFENYWRGHWYWEDGQGAVMLVGATALSSAL